MFVYYIPNVIGEDLFLAYSARQTADSNVGVAYVESTKILEVI